MERSPLTPVATAPDTPSPAANTTAPTEIPTTMRQPDPELVMTSCANCGARMLDRKCKLICTCGYFLSCSDYY